MYLSIRLRTSSSNDIFVIHLLMSRWWIPFVRCSDYHYLPLTKCLKQMTQPLTGMDFSSDSTKHDFSFESTTTTAQLLLTKVLLRLHWLCSYLDFFPRASPLSERSVELRSFRFLLLFFCPWYLNKHTRKPF
jgi:hypothetical protein